MSGKTFDRCIIAVMTNIEARIARIIDGRKELVYPTIQNITASTVRHPGTWQSLQVKDDQVAHPALLCFKHVNPMQPMYFSLMDIVQISSHKSFVDTWQRHALPYRHEQHQELNVVLAM